MTLGKYLIEHTGYWEKDKDNDDDDNTLDHCSQESHWFWGYLAQLDWQRRSGRLQDPATWKAQDDIAALEGTTTSMGTMDFAQNDKISQESWWGYMNLQFSIAVYCGAAEAGLVPFIQLGGNVDANAGFQECVKHWKSFWDIHHREFVASMTGGNTTEKQRKVALITLYQQLWRTHTKVILAGVAHAKDLEVQLPKEDRNIGLGWCQMVEMLAAMSWTQLSLKALCKFGVGYLPTVRLAGPETVEWIQHHRPKEYVTIQSLWQLKDTPPATIQKLCRFWSRVTRWDFQRDTMPRTLNTLSHGTGAAKVLAFTKILTLAIAPKSIPEVSAWVAAMVGSVGVVCMSRNKKN